MRLTIKTKLALTFLSIFILCGAAIFLAVRGLDNTGKAFGKTVEVDVPELHLINNLIERKIFTLYSRVVYTKPRGTHVITAQAMQLSSKVPYQPPCTVPMGLV